MAVREDRDILLPPESDRLEVLRRVRSILRGFRPAKESVLSKSAPSGITAADLWAAFEYLAGEYETTGHLREDLADTLAAKSALQSGQARFDLQCRLAGVLADRGSARFHVALWIATRLPVPQARTALLQMLTQPDLARWTLPAAAASPGGNGAQAYGLDLRPAVVAALGQLRDPSLLGVFHRLLEKLLAAPAGQENVTAAVQWSLMNLAPGGCDEPVPAAILSTGSHKDRTPPVAPAGLAGDGTSTAEALRVLAAFRDRPAAISPPPARHPAPEASGRANHPQEPPAGPSERDELLSGF